MDSSVAFGKCDYLSGGHWVSGVRPLNRNFRFSSQQPHTIYLFRDLQRMDAFLWPGPGRATGIRVPCRESQSRVPQVSRFRDLGYHGNLQSHISNIARLGHPPDCNYFSQWILISWSSGLNSGSPVTSSAFFSLASAAAKASAKLNLKRALKSAAVSANARVVE